MGSDDQFLIIAYRFTLIRLSLSYFRVLKLAVVTALLVYVVIDVAIDSPRNIISLAGLAAFVVIFYITSTNPSKVCVEGNS